MKQIILHYVIVLIFCAIHTSLYCPTIVTDSYMQQSLREVNKGKFTSPEQEKDFEQLLSGQDCKKCNLSNLILTNLLFTVDGDYSESDFSGSDLRGSRFKANLTRTKFQKVKANGAIFDGSTITEANFTGAGLGNTNFENTIGEKPNFTDADCNLIRFGGAKLPGIIVSNTNLTYADFLYTDISNAIGLSVRRSAYGNPIIINDGNNKLYINEINNTPATTPTNRINPTARFCGTIMPLEKFSPESPTKNIFVATPCDGKAGTQCSASMVTGRFNPIDKESFAIDIPGVV
jgi:hypothetical protein